MHTSFLTDLIILLSLFYGSVIAQPDKFIDVAVRQSTTLMNTQCMDYSRTANFSTIGANSTYRTAFLQASPQGTLSNQRMLNAAIKKLPSLMMDKALNQACGNLSTIAVTEAARNFTMGMVAQFKGVSPTPGSINGGPIVAVLSVLIVIMLLATWGLSP